MGYKRRVALRLIIADDDALARALIEAIVERDRELELVGSAEDAERAIELAKEHQPDVAVLDWVMPGGGGEAAAREILRRSPDTKILALTTPETRTVDVAEVRGVLAKGSPPRRAAPGDPAKPRAASGQSNAHNPRPVRVQPACGPGRIPDRLGRAPVRITGRARYDRRPVGAAEIVAIAAAGMAAGAINTLVGSGTLITFPVLLAFGYSPVTANVSNNVGLVPGSVAGAIGYRRELEGQRTRALRFALASALGAVTGAVLLLVLPAEAFKAIVPVFIAIALVSVVLQPRLDRLVASRRPPPDAHGTGLPRVLVYLAGVYGGYFGAAQGILLLAILGLALPDDLQRVNALKNVLAGVVNGVAAVIFILVADIAWGPAALIAAGSVVGAQLAARYGRRMSARALRAVIVAVGIAAIVQLVT